MTEIQQGPQPKSWNDGTHKVDYYPWFTGAHPHFYVLSDAKSGQLLSNMALGESGEVLGLETHPKYRNQGLATKLWTTAQKNHKEQKLPAPRHSKTMTKSGEAWAQKVGGELPKDRRISNVTQMRNMLGWN